MNTSLPPEEQARADIYRLLAALLAGPPGGELLGLLRGITPGEGPLATVWKALRTAAEGADPDVLEAEYHALFIGLGRGELVPYGSWYQARFLMEKPLANLRADLARLGFARRPEVCEPEDHAAALCEVMGVMIAESGLSFMESKAFFETHIGSWMGGFFEDLEGAEVARFYQPVGQLGRHFIAIEQAYYAMPA